MPIMYIHGVATRKDGSYEASWEEIRKNLRQYVVPVLPNVDVNKSIQLIDVYWGDLGVQVPETWRSRPLSPTLGMGGSDEDEAQERTLAAADFAAALADVPLDDTSAAESGRLLHDTSLLSDVETPRLTDINFSSQQLAAMLVTLLMQLETNETLDVAYLKQAAEQVAFDPTTIVAIDSLNGDEQIDRLIELLVARYDALSNADGVQGKGGADTDTDKFWNDLRERVSETLHRGKHVTGFTVTRVAAEFRRYFNDMLLLFLGDVFTYLTYRGTPANPGPIPQRMLKQLEYALNHKTHPDEPLIVLTHSMGGQIVYDLVTQFLPQHQPAKFIDFWCATASQVGLFEEMALFLHNVAPTSGTNPFLAPVNTGSAGTAVGFPPHVGHWWNVWDHNDFLSFTANGIIEGVDDGPFNSWVSARLAHSAYLTQREFWLTFQAKLKSYFSPERHGT